MMRMIKFVHCKHMWKSNHAVRPLNQVILLGSSRHYSDNTSHPRAGGGGTGKFLLAVGALIAGGGATLAYAKYDKDFRKTLTGVAPFTDSLIATFWQEDSKDNLLVNYYKNIKGLVTGTQDSIETPSPKPSVNPKLSTHVPPPPIMPIKEEKPKSDVREVKLEKDTKQDSTKIDSKALPKPEKSQRDKSEYSPQTIEKLEQKLSDSVEEAVNAYKKAVYVLKQYNSDIEYIIDEAVDEIKSEMWDQIKNRTKTKIETTKKAFEKAEAAVKEINHFKSLVSSPHLNLPDSKKDIIKNNIIKFQDDIEKAKKEFELERKAGSISEKYWNKVEKAREHFSEVLQSLFPTIDLNRKELNIKKEDLDLFILHAYSHIVFYQKELAKLDTVIAEKIQQAIEAAKKGGFEGITEAQLIETLEHEKRKISLNFQQKALKLKKEHEWEMRDALKRQSQTFTDHLQDEVKKREDEIQRRLSRKYDEALENERSKAKIQMAAVVGRLKGIDEALQERQKAEEAAKQGQVLWSACQSLLRALTIGCPGLSWKEQIRPLDPEIKSVEKAAAENDELVLAVINGIPKEARERGVYPEDALRERFLKVEQVARTVALVPAEGAALPIHLLSFLQSLLLIKAASPIPQAELNDEKVDISNLDTNEILQRARYWLDRGDFTQTLKYMNLLKGAPRSVAREWMNETRIYLETRQAANTLMAYATSSGLTCL